MTYVVLIFGASGSGKSTLMEALSRAGRQYSIHLVATTRPAREIDGIEISCVSDVTVEDYDYIFQIYGFRYGVQRRQIDNALRLEQHHFVVCSDIDVIRQIKCDYPTHAKAIFQYSDAPREAVHDILRRRKVADDEIVRRLASADVLYTTFAEEWDLFDGTLVNRFGQPALLLDRMELLLHEFDERKEPAPRPASRYRHRRDVGQGV